MNKTSKLIITFIICLVAAYLIAGYVNNGMFVSIKWAEGTTIWHKLRWYYVLKFSINILPSLIIAIISTLTIVLVNRKRK